MTPQAASAPRAEHLDGAINQAIDCLRNEQPDACIAACESALRIDPDCPEALLILGLASLVLGEPAHAITLIEKAYAANDTLHPFAQALAVAHAHAGHVNDGLFYAKLATTLPPHPRFPDILPPPFDNFLANLEEAKPFLYRSRAAMSAAAGQFADAVEAAAKQLAMTPGDPETLRILARACTAAGATERAVATGHALVHGDHAEAADFTILGDALAAAGRWSAAAGAHATACTIAPDDPVVAAAGLASAVAGPHTDPAATAAAHATWHRRFAAPRPSRAPRRAERLRVGYLSNAFHDGDLAHLLAPVLEAHAAAGVEAYCYADACRNDLVAEHIIDVAARWTDFTDVNDATATAILEGDDLDIAVDLTGHGRHGRLAALAPSAVPVVAGWFAYPHPCGLDHFITTAAAWPGGPEPQTGDAIAALPQVLVPYRPPAIMPAVNPAPALANGHPTFGINGDLAHIGAATAAAVRPVLAAHPGARLLIGNSRDLDEAAIDRCYDAFANAGLRHRVDIVDAAANFATPFDFYHHVDVAFAPVPANTVVETCRALWMGVPVICPAADRPAGRYAAATLAAAGLGDWIAADAAALLAIADHLVVDPQALAGVRAGLRQRVAQSPLADVAGATRALEDLYRKLIAAV